MAVIIHNHTDDPSRPTTSLLEREGSLELLRHGLCGAITTSRAAVLFVESGAGLGLTATLDQLTSGFPQSDNGPAWTHLRVCADEHDASVPLSLLGRLTELLLGLPAAPSLFGQGPGRVLASTLPASRHRSRSVSEIDEPTIVLELGQLLNAITCRAPLVLVVDDAHLADDESLRVLRTTWSRGNTRPMALIIGARRSNPPRAELSRMRRIAETSVVLSPLTTSGTGRLLARQGVAVPPETLPIIHALSRGRPAELADLRLEPAPSVHEVVAQLASLRIAELTHPRRRTLEVVVVLGSIDRADARTTLPGLTDQPEDCVAELRRIGLLAADDPIRCAHVAISEAVRGTITPSEADEIRRAALATAIDAGASGDSLAWLAASCAPRGDQVVVDLLAAAGERHLGSGHATEALSVLRRALREPPHPARTVQLRGKLALASVLAGESGSPTLVRRAVLELEPLGGAQLARRASVLLAAQGRAREATTMIDDLRVQLRDADPEVESILSMAWIAAARLDVSMRPAVRRRMEDLTHRNRLDSSPSGRALAGLLAYELGIAGEDRPRVIALARHALDHDTQGSPTADLGSIWSAVLALQFADELDEAAAALLRLERRGELRGRRTDVYAAHHLRVPVERMRGNLDRARRSAAVVAEAVRQGWRGSVPGGAGNRMRLALLTGPVDESLLTQELPEGIERHADDPSLVEYLDARGQVRFHLGHHEQALADHLSVRDRHQVLGAWNPATILWAHGAARAMAALGRRPEALALLDDQLELARRWGAPRTIGALLTVAGGMRGGKAGAGQLDEAVAVLDEASRPIELAEAHLARGRIAHHRGDSRNAERDARRAIQLSRDSGADAITAEASGLLADVDHGAATLSTPNRLTPAELRTARLAAVGATNKEIAAQLFVSRKAVEFHLSNVYRKLGVRGRADLPRALCSDPDPHTSTTR